MPKKLAWLVPLLCLPPVFAETVVLKNFTLIDGTGKVAAAGMAIVIVDGKIQSVSPAAKVKAPKDAETVDLSGKFVMPGIINLHAHLGTTKDMAQDIKFFTRESVEQHLQTYASYGVTSLVSLGTDLDLIYDMRAQQRADRPKETRIFTAGRGLVMRGGYPPAQGMRSECDTVAECTGFVEELAAKKPDLVKIWVDGRNGRSKKFPPEVSQAIISTAHRHGLKVVAHIVYQEDAQQLVDEGLNALAHSVRDQPVDDKLIASMKEHGTWLIPTLTRDSFAVAYDHTPAFLDDPFVTRTVPPSVIATLKSAYYQKRVVADPDFPKYAGMFENSKHNLKRLADAGIPYGFGTDSNFPGRFVGYAEHWEMELMVEAGLTPMQVITAATKSGAEFLGAKDLGTLEKGKWADLIVLTKNPVDDIRNTRTIQAVYIAGNRVYAPNE
jgi:imidazolonepropionase-like amidohydrolase